MKNSKAYGGQFLLGLLTGLLLVLSSCIGDHVHVDLAGPDEYYTCSMDPQVVENKDGMCPICHMKLIKVKKSNLKPGQIKLSTQQIHLANITFDTLRRQELSKEITLTGKVTVDQNLSLAISARVQGRIEKLTVRSTGDFVKKGQLLYEIYSEELVRAQLDFIQSTQKDLRSEGLEQESFNRLLQLGMTDSQVEQLKSTRQALSVVPVYASSDGFVNEVSVSEGAYVSSGTTLFRLASLESLWVEAQVYLPYLAYLKPGAEAHFSIPAASESIFPGKVIFIDPQVQSPQRFVLARFQLANPSLEIRPGMMANIIIQTEKRMVLALPGDGIIQGSAGASVWVLNTDDVFENKMVKVGLQNSRLAEIMEGLQEGNVVVVSGAYLLNSEYIFKKGATPMEGHAEMPGMKMK